MRYLTLFLAAMFFASNAAAAVRACIADLAGQEHVVAHALDTRAGEPLCLPSDDAGPCLKHYAQTYQNEEQNAWADFTPLALAPVLTLLHASFQAQPKAVVTLLTPPIVGPPLTILFRNFRN